MSRDDEVEVLIVGGGPVGLSAAIALSRLGVSTLVVERTEEISEHPRATLINTRTMELLRQWGLDDAVKSLGISIEYLATIRWMTRLANPELGKLEIVESAEKLMRMMAQAPVLPAICAQNRFESLLRSALAETDAIAWYGTEMLSLEQDARSVSARVVDAGGAEREVDARYALGCDGASSRVCRELHMEQLERSVLGELIDVHFSAELAPFVADRRSALYWIANPDVRGVLIAVGGGTGEWLLNRPFFRSEGERAERFDEEACVELVKAAVGAEPPDLQIHSIRPWRMHSVRARQFRAGRVFLAGDAAHQFPPTGGFGMNTGIQDAHNLAWKLAAVLADEAGEELLDTYETERVPVADFNGEQSVLNAERMRDLLYGLEVGELRALEDEGPDSAALRERFAREIPLQRPHFDFQGQTLGFSYEHGAVVPDGSPSPLVADAVVDYVPTARPGSRAPHVWLRDREGERSTIDLFDRGPVLLAPATGGDWRAAASRIAAAEGVGISFFTIGDGGDFEDPHDEFPSAYGLEPSGAVLVRPDGHVGWRTARVPADPLNALQQAVATVLRSPLGKQDQAHVGAH